MDSICILLSQSYMQPKGKVCCLHLLSENTEISPVIHRMIFVLLIISLFGFIKTHADICFTVSKRKLIYFNIK